MQVHAAAVDKGFWHNPISDLQARTWRQLCHIADELHEAGHALVVGKEAVSEELADVCIVILDLLGAYGVEFDVRTLQATPRSDTYLIKIMRTFRKEDRLDQVALIHIMEGCAWSIGGTDKLYDEIYAKMLKNAQRPQLYGVARENEGG